MKKNVFIVNPYNDNHINKLIDFEKENSLEQSIVPDILNTREKIPEKDYERHLIEDNEFQQDICQISEDRIVDHCRLHFEKDRKCCYVMFSKIKKSHKSRSIIEFAESCAFDMFGMEEMFITVPLTDSQLISELNYRGLENLGQEEDTVSFVAERDTLYVNSKVA